MTCSQSEAKVSGILEIARSYVAAGIGVVPIRRDGSKAPPERWKHLEERRATDAELRRWFGGRQPYGIATIGGAISSNLEQLDFDRDAGTLFPAWCEMVDVEQPGLSDSLHVVETPAAGYHVKYLCPDTTIPGNTKLAIDPAAPPDDRTLIETRGEGGYCVAPGSPAECHPSSKLYQHISGPMMPEAITPEQREILIRCARSFTRETKEPPRQVGLDLRPGDDFDRRGPDWSKILEPAGWRCVYGSPAGERRWRRPGKNEGWSATTGHCRGSDGAELLRVFSSNAAPFEDSKAYGKFRAYSLLRHGGNLSAAADELARQGYGSRFRSPAPHRQEHSAPAAVSQPEGPPWPSPLVETFTAADLMRMEIPPPRWAIDNIIPEGLTCLAGKPKLGKSWLVLHAALAISAGGMALGHARVEAGEVLYISLEDTKRRLQSRIRRLLGPGEAPSPRLHLAHEWPRQDKGGWLALDEWLATHPDARLVIIDTWGRWRPFRTVRGEAYEIDYGDGCEMKKLADRYSVSIIIVHHCRKLAAGDPLEEVSGSVGLTAACDGVLVLRRERGQHDAALMVTGRDVDEQDLALTFDARYCLWQVVGEADECRRSRERQDILDLFTDGAEMSISQIIAKSSRTPAATRQLVSRLAREGLLKTTRRGMYQHPARDESQESQSHNPFIDGEE
ncbi:MAG TPA: AAA family ATPase [Gemmataceae bacterium]|jgi:hypothetical protein